MKLPTDWLTHQDSTGRWSRWLDALPRLHRDVVDEWDLRVEAEPWHGYASLVWPVLTGTDESAVLKIGFPHSESAHEHLALQHWRGNGAVRLLRADPGRAALLLERLDTTDLTDVWDLEACEIVATLYRSIHVPALPQLSTLTSYVHRWTDRLEALPRSAPLPRRLVEQAVALGRDFAGDQASTGTMIHTDLHYENVLASTRPDGPRWLAIDPKPVSGDPHYEVAPLLWNRWAELAGDIRGGVRRRFHATIDAAGLDEDRARDWVIVRMLHNALWQLEDHPPGGATAPSADYLTTCVAVAKAVQG